jgi:hypothetical protein
MITFEEVGSDEGREVDALRKPHGVHALLARKAAFIIVMIHMIIIGEGEKADSLRQTVGWAHTQSCLLVTIAFHFLFF